MAGLAGARTGDTAGRYGREGSCAARVPASWWLARAAGGRRGVARPRQGNGKAVAAPGIEPRRERRHGLGHLENGEDDRSRGGGDALARWIERGFGR